MLFRFVPSYYLSNPFLPVIALHLQPLPLSFIAPASRTFPISAATQFLSQTLVLSNILFNFRHRSMFYITSRLHFKVSPAKSMNLFLNLKVDDFDYCADSRWDTPAQPHLRQQYSLAKPLPFQIFIDELKTFAFNNEPSNIATSFWNILIPQLSVKTQVIRNMRRSLHGSTNSNHYYARQQLSHTMLGTALERWASTPSKLQPHV